MINVDMKRSHKHKTPDDERSDAVFQKCEFDEKSTMFKLAVRFYFYVFGHDS